MNLPNLIIGPMHICKEKVERSEDHKEIDGNASIQEIKNFRNFLNKPTIYEYKTAVITNIQKTPPASQAVLLKVLENLPHNCKVFILAAYMPSFTIKTRCRTTILYSRVEKEPELKKGYEFMQIALQKKNIDENLLNGWKILLKTISWLREGAITQEQKNTILKGLGF